MEKALRKHLPDGKFTKVPATRSGTMSAVRGSGNKTTEVRARLGFVRAGLKGWRVQANELPGRPDFVFSREKVAVFVDGCFWHGCPKCGHVPKTNCSFWRAKLRRNRQRDLENTAALEAKGFAIVRLWEHELNADLQDCVNEVVEALRRVGSKKLA